MKLHLLEGKKAIVTGSGANIGEACAKMLAMHGASVCIADINEEGAERVVSEIRQSGGNAFAVRLDLADEESVCEMVSKAIENFGTIDVLHNNAAKTEALQMNRDGLLVDMEAEVWDAAFEAAPKMTGQDLTLM